MLTISTDDYTRLTDLMISPTSGSELTGHRITTQVVLDMTKSLQPAGGSASSVEHAYTPAAIQQRLIKAWYALYSNRFWKGEAQTKVTELHGMLSTHSDDEISHKLSRFLETHFSIKHLPRLLSELLAARAVPIDTVISLLTKLRVTKLPEYYNDTQEKLMMAYLAQQVACCALMATDSNPLNLTVAWRSKATFVNNATAEEIQFHAPNNIVAWWSEEKVACVSAGAGTDTSLDDTSSESLSSAKQAVTEATDIASLLRPLQRLKSTQLALYQDTHYTNICLLCVQQYKTSSSRAIKHPNAHDPFLKLRQLLEYWSESGKAPESVTSTIASLDCNTLHHTSESYDHLKHVISAIIDGEDLTISLFTDVLNVCRQTNHLNEEEHTTILKNIVANNSANHLKAVIHCLVQRLNTPGPGTPLTGIGLDLNPLLPSTLLEEVGHYGMPLYHQYVDACTRHGVSPAVTQEVYDALEP